ncbi:MAG: tetratricopeptide repeat protein [Blastocatellia bacterium]
MKKENVLLGVIGILAGLIIGYIGTDYLNKSNNTKLPAADGKSRASASQEPADPSGAGNSGGAGPDIMAAIETARKEPNNFEAQMKAGGMFREIRRFEQALPFYQNAVKANPQDVEAQAKLGDTLFDLQQFEDAATSYQSALQLQPRNATVRMDLGLTWFLRTPRDLDKAIAEFRSALSIDPRHEKALQNLTAAYLEKGDKTAARQTIDQLAGVNPGNQSIDAFKSKLAE